MDPYKRDNTVRIGKWRWPPPKEEIAAMEGEARGENQGEAEGFLEFKMRKLQERKQSAEQQQKQDGEEPGGKSHQQKRNKHSSEVDTKDDEFDTSGEIQGIEWGEDDDDDFVMDETDKLQIEQGDGDNVGMAIISKIYF